MIRPLVAIRDHFAEHRKRTVDYRHLKRQTKRPLLQERAVGRIDKLLLLAAVSGLFLLAEPSIGQPIVSDDGMRSSTDLIRLTNRQVRDEIIGMEVTTAARRSYLVFETGKFVIGGGHQPRYVLGTYHLSNGVIKYHLADETMGRRAYYKDGFGRYFEADDDDISRHVAHPVSVRKLEPMPSVP